EIGQRLKVGLVLDQLLGAAVKQPHMRIDPLDDLAVELHHHPQHAMRRRMLRPEIDRVVRDDVVAGGGRLVELRTAHWSSSLSSIAGGSASVCSAAFLSVFSPAPVCFGLSVVLGSSTGGGPSAFSSPGRM